MNLTDQQRRMIRAILSVFETGAVRGNPAAVAVLRDGAGISYGMHQGTRASGTLWAIVDEYVEQGGALAADLASYLPRLKRKDASLDRDEAFKALLRRAGADPVMREAQEAVFDRLYFEPALRAATALGLESALGAAVVYDGKVHGSFDRFAKIASAGGSAADDEPAWIRRYLTARREWLKHHGKPILRGTVYRPDTFLAALKAGNLALDPPITAHGRRITLADVGVLDPAPFADAEPEPVVVVETPAIETPAPAETVTVAKVTGGSGSWARTVSAWITGLFASASSHVQSLFGLTPEIQKILIVLVVVLGVVYLATKFFAERQVRAIASDPKLDNVK